MSVYTCPRCGTHVHTGWSGFFAHPPWCACTGHAVVMYCLDDSVWDCGGYRLRVVPVMLF